MTSATKGWLDFHQARELEDISNTHDRSLLLTTLWIGETAHHCNAVRVNAKGEYSGTDENGQSLLDDYYCVYEYPWQTTKIRGYRGSYVILIHPHGD